MSFEMMLMIIEYIGTIAFAISGAIIAIENRMDILGVTILGTTTANILGSEGEVLKKLMALAMVCAISIGLIAFVFVAL